MIVLWQNFNWRIVAMTDKKILNALDKLVMNSQNMPVDELIERLDNTKPGVLAVGIHPELHHPSWAKENEK